MKISPQAPNTVKPGIAGDKAGAGKANSEKVKKKLPPPALTGILAGTRSELSIYERLMEGRVTTLIGGQRFVTGKLAGRPVALGACGPGKIHAALATSALIGRYQPSEIVLTGPAGALQAQVRQGDLLVVERAGFHDVGVDGPGGRLLEQPLDLTGGAPLPLYFPTDQRLLNAAALLARELSTTSPRAPADRRPPRVVRGDVLSGDVFCASDKKREELLAAFRAQALDSETAAVAQVCWQQGVPFLAIRGVAYRAGDGALEECRRLSPSAAGNAARFAAALVARLGNP